MAVIRVCDDCKRSNRELHHFYDNYSSQVPRPEYDFCISCLRKRVASRLAAGKELETVTKFLYRVERHIDESGARPKYLILAYQVLEEHPDYQVVMNARGEALKWPRYRWLTFPIYTAAEENIRQLDELWLKETGK